MNLIQYIETIEVLVDSASKTRFYLGEQPTLRNKNIVYCLQNSTSVSKSPSGRSLVNGTVMFKAFLVLVSKGKEVINKYPLNYLINSHHFPSPLEINRVIDWPKSFIEITDTTGLVADEAFILTMYCSKTNVQAPRGIGLNTEVIEVKTTPATLRQYYLPDHENLQDKVIHHLEYAWSTELTKTPSNASLVNATVKAKTYLTMVSGGRDIVKRLPLHNLNVASFGGWKSPLSFKPDLSKSFFEIPDTGDLVADEVFLLFVEYWDKTIRR